MENRKKLKVVLLCHFSTKDIRNKLYLSQRKVSNLIRRLLHKTELKYCDFAPWIDCIISQSPTCQTIDLHLVAPHNGMVKSKQEFDLMGVSYHFFKNRPSSLIKYIDRRLFKRHLVNYKNNKREIIGFINTIKPDLIVLVGTENIHFSSALINIQGYPIFILCQTIINDSEFKSFMSPITYQKLSSNELQLLDSTNYVGVYSEKHYHLLKELGYKGYIFDFQWPNNTRPIVVNTGNEKHYDFINFSSRMSKEKGYHDSIQAMAIVKKRYPNAKLVLVDSGDIVVRNELEAIIVKEGLEHNVSFVPFFEQREDLFRFLSEVRFAVLPCKVDYISGTQLQAMAYGLPIVVYKTDGTPTLNAKKECALIVEKGNVVELAEKMLHLLGDCSLAETLKNNGLEYMEEYRNKNNDSFNKLLRDFEAIVANYKKGVEIPSNLLLR